MKVQPPPPPPAWKSRLLSVGVTGTNGKTTTVTLVARLLSLVSAPVARATTVGAFLGDEPADVPHTHGGFVELMHRCLERGGQFVAAEMTSEALARGFAGAWPCEVAVFTNLSHDHMDAHGTPEHYLASKAQLFMHVPRGGTVVFNAADENSALLEEVVQKGVRIWRYAVADRGDTSQADLVATNLVIRADGTECTLHASPILGRVPEVLRIRGAGSIYVENALGALLGAMAAGVPADRAVEELANVPMPPGRFEIVRANPLVVVDFAHTPDGLLRTVAAARAVTPPDGKLWVVFGAGGNRDQKKRAPMGAAASTADYIVLTSDNPRNESPLAIADAIAAGIPEGASASVIRELDRKRAIETTIAAAGPNDVVLIAGRGHESEQTIGKEKIAFSDAEVARNAARSA
ncbi:MAG: UDP-N-acetylmuramyl-tripeptide synthetase [Polyangiaceae bacterium]